MSGRLSVIIISTLIPLVFSCGSQNVKPIPDAEDQFEIAKRQYQKKDWSDAILEFQKLIFNYPGFGKVDSAQFLLAMSYYNDKEYPLSAGEFNKLVFSFPTSPLTDDAMFYAGVCALKQSPGSELDQEYTHLAVERFEAFLEEYPESERVPQAEKTLSEARDKLAKKTYKNGELYAKMKNYDAALIYLNEVLDLYGSSPWAAQALFLLGDVYLKQGKLDQAKILFRDYIENYPQNKLTDKAKKKINEIEKNKSR